ncbi:MAG: DUF3536 domain-containing protein [Desulfomonilaceae bacterium]|nr:DUF3536 domain-containing protein [Desulfomonilaceae bacterium]
MTHAVSRFICIHGHFYQPPRENPWLESIEHQESAHPYHDWNERIAVECYTPNAHARILDEQGRLRQIINNYEYMSFNFGPTLLSWLERHVPHTYRAILDADRASSARLSGHGNAIAQPYNHMIMPLASTRDKVTQILWGIEDFTTRFNRAPEGMWLPETAVDAETLDLLAQYGILFTILAPTQARRFRLSPADAWTRVDGSALDPSVPYLCGLPGGRTISLFFYDAPISHAVAFEKLLDSGDEFQKRLMAAFSSQANRAQLVHVATDGESYGHHHRFGEMALSYAIEKILADPAVQLVNYGYFLQGHPPTAEAEFIEDSSWSCAHGVGRWSRDCGCSLSRRSDWNQRWRGVLRESMDLIRDRVDELFERETASLVKDPWELRNRYIRVVLDHHSNPEEFLTSAAGRHLSAGELRTLSALLEMQRNRMLMYTSCGWFFDDISGLESRQVLRYAARVLQLAEPWDPDLQPDFLTHMASALSNLRPYLRGDEIFVRQILPHVADLPQVAAHIGIFSLFRNVPIEDGFFCYEMEAEDFSRFEFGERVLIVGSVTVRNHLIVESRKLVLVVVYFGGLDFRCSVSDYVSKTGYYSLKRDLSETFQTRSATEVVRKLDRYFPGDYFSLEDLFAEQRSQIIQSIIHEMYEPQAQLFEAFYHRNKDLSRFVKKQSERVADTFRVSAQFVLNRSFTNELHKLESGSFPEGLPALMDEAKEWGIQLDVTAAEKLISNRIHALATRLRDDPQDGTVLDGIEGFLNLASDLELHLQLGEAQIVLLRIARSFRAGQVQELPRRFCDLAEKLAVSTDVC